jgi:hypothetical protein
LSLDNNYISNEAIESARWPGNVEVGVQDQLQFLGDLSEDEDEDA